MVRKIGMVDTYTIERNQALLKAYHEHIINCNKIQLEKLWLTLANQKAPRFFVSEERAAIVVSKLLKGENIEYMVTTRRDMFMEIYSRVQKLLKEKPNLPLLHCCRMVVYQNAPSFYMTPLSIRQTIYKAKRNKFKKRKHLWNITTKKLK